jgi:hypothetical protein
MRRTVSALYVSERWPGSTSSGRWSRLGTAHDTSGGVDRNRMENGGRHRPLLAHCPHQCVSVTLRNPRG